MPTIRFHFDYISPNAYLAWTQLPRLAERRDLIDALVQAERCFATIREFPK